MSMEGLPKAWTLSAPPGPQGASGQSAPVWRVQSPRCGARLGGQAEADGAEGLPPPWFPPHLTNPHCEILRGQKINATMAFAGGTFGR